MRIWQKQRKLQFFQFEAWSSKKDTCCYNILLSVNPSTMVSNYLRQFWHITFMTIPPINEVWIWDPWHLVENNFVETKFGRMRHLVNTTFRRLWHFAYYDNWSKIRRITSKFSRKLIWMEKIKIVYIYGSYISNLFSRQCQYYISLPFVYWKSLYATFLARLLLVKKKIMH